MLILPLVAAYRARLISFRSAAQLLALGGAGFEARGEQIVCRVAQPPLSHGWEGSVRVV